MTAPRSKHHFEQRHTPSSHPIDLVIEGILAATLVFTALAYGGVEAWSQEIFLIGCGALGLCVTARSLLVRKTALTWTWAYVPVAVFLVLVGFEQVAMPAGVLRLVAPGVVGLRGQLLSDLPDAARVLHLQTQSLYPYATAVQWRLVLGISLVFMAALNVGRDRRHIERLLIIVTLAGLAAGCVAAYQDLTSATMIYGRRLTTMPGSGPFANHSHFGQFMNMSTGAALALLLMELARLKRSYGRLSRAIDEISSRAGWKIWIAVAVCLIGPATVFISATRMGMLSLLVAGAVTGLLLAWRARSEGAGSLVAFLGLAALMVMLALGFDKVYSRLTTLRHVAAADEGRLGILEDMTAEFKRFPLLGTGLGTHEYVFPMFDRANLPVTFTHAEDDYAQLLEETGIVGLSMGLWFLGWMVWQAVRALKKVERPVQFAVFGVVLGLMAMLIHSASDFGQHVPADAMVTAILASVLFNLAHLASSPAEPVALGRGRRAMGAAMPVVVTIVLGLCLWPAHRAAQAEALATIADGQRQYMALHASQDARQYVALLQPMTHAVEMAPDNARYQFDLNNDRYHAILAANRRADGLFVWDATNVKYARQILGELMAARPLCPTYGPVLSLEGAIEYFALGDRAVGRSHLQMATMLKPFDPNICLVLGSMDVEDKDWAGAQVQFDRALTLGGPATDIMTVYLLAQRPDLAYAVARRQRPWLQWLAQRLDQDPAESALAIKCREESTNMMVAEATDPSTPPGVQAQLAGLLQARGDWTDAVTFYRKALAGDDGQTAWHLELARCLMALGDNAAATEQAQDVVNADPGNRDALAILDKLGPISRPAATTGPG